MPLLHLGLHWSLRRCTSFDPVIHGSAMSTTLLQYRSLQNVSLGNCRRAMSNRPCRFVVSQASLWTSHADQESLNDPIQTTFDHIPKDHGLSDIEDFLFSNNTWREEAKETEQQLAEEKMMMGEVGQETEQQLAEERMMMGEVGQESECVVEERGGDHSVGKMCF